MTGKPFAARTSLLTLPADLARSTTHPPSSPQSKGSLLTPSACPTRLIFPIPRTLAGKLVVVEFWATWCLPCRSTLSFLGELQEGHRDDLVVLAIAVSSKEAEVRTLLRQSGLADDPSSSSVMGSDELVAQFGGVLAVPTLMVFGRDGKTEAVFYGAPPDLHERVSRLVEELTRKR
jgi:thiol-disulfide isomerase/thioredoxin